MGVSVVPLIPDPHSCRLTRSLTEVTVPKTKLGANKFEAKLSRKLFSNAINVTKQLKRISDA